MFEELKTLIKHSSVYGMAELLRKGIGFIMIPIYTQFLTPADYGLLELLDLTVNVIGMLVGLHIGSALIRYYNYYDDQKGKQEVFTTALAFTFLLSLFVFCILVVLSDPISKLISGSSQYYRYFQITFICLTIQAIYLIPETYLLARKKSLLYSALSTGTLISNLSLNIFFLVVMRMGVFGILLSMLITKAINCLIVSAITLRHIRYSFSLEKLKKMIWFSLPLVPASISMFIIHFSDRFFIQMYCNLNDLGLYSLGYKFGMIISIIVSTPIFKIWDTQRFEIAKNNNAQQIFKKIFTYYSAVIIFVGLGISVFIDEIVSVMAASEYKGASTIVPLIVLSYVFYGMASYFTLGIMIRNKTKYAAYIQLCAAGINLLLNMFFISSYGIIGAAISTVLTFLFIVLLNFIVSQKIYPIPFEYGRVFILFALAIFLFGLSRLVELPFLMSLGIKSFLILGFPLILFIGKFFNEEEISKGMELLKTIRSRFVIKNGLAGIVDKVKK